MMQDPPLTFCFKSNPTSSLSLTRTLLLRSTTSTQASPGTTTRSLSTVRPNAQLSVYDSTTLTTSSPFRPSGTGLAFVQNLGDGKGFLWLNNSLYTDTKRDLKNAGGLSVKARERALRERFVDLCGSEDALRQSYKTARLARERDFEVIELMEGPRGGGGAGAAMTKTISNLSANSIAPPTTVTATATGGTTVEPEAAPPAAPPPSTPINPANAPLPPTPAPVHATLLSPPHDQPDGSHLPSV